MLNGIINPFLLTGQQDPDDFLRLVLEGINSPEQDEEEPTQLEDVVVTGQRPAQPVAGPYGSYMGNQVAPNRDPYFLERMQGLQEGRDSLMDQQTSRARDSEAYARNQTANAGLLTTAGGILSRSLPDATPYINARTRRDEQLTNSENLHIAGRERDQDKISTHIGKTYDDEVAVEGLEHTRRRTRKVPVQGYLTTEGNPVFLDQDADGGPRYVDDQGNQVHMGSLRKMDPDTQILETTSGYALVNKTDGTVTMLTSGGGTKATGGNGATGGGHLNPDGSLSQDFINAVIHVESRGDPNAVSSAGAKGRMQVMDDTNRDPGYGVRPAQNDSAEERERVGRDYLQALHRHYGGDTQKTLAAYNGGPGRVDQAIARARRTGGDWLDYMPAESRAYVPSVLNRFGSTGGVQRVSNTQNSGGGDVLRPLSSASATNLQFFDAADGTRMAVDPRTGVARPVTDASGNAVRTTAGAGSQEQQANNRARQVAANNLRTSLERLAELEDNLTVFDSGLVGGGVSNRVANLWGSDSDEYDNQVAIVRRNAMALMRIPGEGPMSNYDAEQIEQMMPNRRMTQDARRNSISSLTGILGNVQDSIPEGTRGRPQSNGSGGQQQAPGNSAVGTVININGNRYRKRVAGPDSNQNTWEKL